MEALDRGEVYGKVTQSYKRISNMIDMMDKEYICRCGFCEDMRSAGSDPNLYAWAERHLDTLSKIWEERLEDNL